MARWRPLPELAIRFRHETTEAAREDPRPGGPSDCPAGGQPAGEGPGAADAVFEPVGRVGSDETGSRGSNAGEDRRAVPRVLQALPAAEKERTYSLSDYADYADFLAAVSDSGIEVLVTGGIAVGAYALLRGESVLSGELDVYTTLDTQIQVMEWASAKRVPIVKRPQPRALSVVLLDWKGKEVNVPTETSGLPRPAGAFQDGGAFRLTKRGSFSALLVDPYDLLRCKLEVNRPKDRPLEEVMRRFLEEEVVELFRTEVKPRDRNAPARRTLDVLGAQSLPEALAHRLLPLARTASDFRFLLGRAPTKELEDAVLWAIPEALGLREELERIEKRRRGAEAHSGDEDSPIPDILIGMWPAAALHKPSEFMRCRRSAGFSATGFRVIGACSFTGTGLLPGGASAERLQIRDRAGRHDRPRTLRDRA